MLDREQMKHVQEQVSARTGDISEISKVAGEALATHKCTTTPGEQREESLLALRKATNKSASAEEVSRKHNKKLDAARKPLEDLEAKTVGL